MKSCNKTRPYNVNAHFSEKRKSGRYFFAFFKSLANKVNGISLPNNAQIYLSKAGNDSTGGLGKDKPFLTLTAAIQFAQNIFPKNEIGIFVEDGTYNEPAIAITDLPFRLYVRGVSGNPELVKIICSTSNAVAITTYNVQLFLAGITVESTVSGIDYGTLHYNYSTYYIANCIIKSNKGCGLVAGHSQGSVSGSKANNCTRALYTYSSSILYSDTNTGTGNDTGITSHGSLVIANGSIPTATTEYSKIAGGIIFKGGVLV